MVLKVLHFLVWKIWAEKTNTSNQQLFQPNGPFWGGCLIPLCACKATYFFLSLTLNVGVILGQIWLSSARFYLHFVVGEQASKNSVCLESSLPFCSFLGLLAHISLFSLCLKCMKMLLDDNKCQFFNTNTGKITKGIRKCSAGRKGEVQVACPIWAP